METLTQRDWISADEFRTEWRRLRELRLLEDSPEVTDLLDRVGRRDDALFERYGRHLVDANPNKWVAISLDGETLIRDASWQAHRDGEARFGPSAFALRKLNHDFQGFELRH